MLFALKKKVIVNYENCKTVKTEEDLLISYIEDVRYKFSIFSLHFLFGVIRN